MTATGPPGAVLSETTTGGQAVVDEDGGGVVLTARQAEMLQLIADGMTVQEAGRHLGVAAKTAYNHVNAVHRRLGTQTVYHALVAAVRLGVVTLDRNSPPAPVPGPCPSPLPGPGRSAPASPPPVGSAPRLLARARPAHLRAGATPETRPA